MWRARWDRETIDYPVSGYQEVAEGSHFPVFFWLIFSSFLNCKFPKFPATLSWESQPALKQDWVGGWGCRTNWIRTLNWQLESHLGRPISLKHHDYACHRTGFLGLWACVMEIFFHTNFAMMFRTAPDMTKWSIRVDLWKMHNLRCWVACALISPTVCLIKVSCRLCVCGYCYLLP